MTDLSNLPVEEKIRNAAHAVEPRSEFSEALWNKIAETPRKVTPRFTFKQFFMRPAWAAAAALVLVALVVSAAAPQAVVNAFNSLLAYLPGIGFIQNDDSTLYLKHPITVEQDGFVLTVEQAISDAEKTVIAYRVDGLPAGSDCLYDVNQLQFPTGNPRLPIGGEVHGGQARVEFPTLPSGVKEATLLVSLSEASAACKAPANWEVRIPFGTIPPDAPLLPVVEYTPSQPLSVTPETSAAAPAVNTAEASANPDNVRFTFDRVVELSDGYLVTGKTLWDNQNWENAVALPENIRVFDASGAEIPVAPTEEGTKDNNFTFKIAGKTFQNPLTVQIQSVMVWEMRNPAASFTFDAGENPQIGQSWPLEKTLDVEGLKIALHTIRPVYEDFTGTAGSSGTPNGYAVELTLDPHISNMGWICRGAKDFTSVSGQAKKSEQNSYTFEMVYSGGLPTGLLTCDLSDMQFDRQGPWQAQLQIP